jgi:predicted transcriptional regulator of viral defense system
MKRGRRHSPKKKPRVQGKTIPSQLKRLGIFRTDAARAMGVSQPTLSRWVAVGRLYRAAPGLYSHPDFKIDPTEMDFAVASAVFGPKSVIGGMTALFHYGLIEQVPSRIWVLVPSTRRSAVPTYRLIRTQTNPSIGVEDHGLYRMSNLERTLVEALRYSSKIGLRVALRAVRTALAERRTTLDKILRQAKALGLARAVERHWETLVPEGQAA